MTKQPLILVVDDTPKNVQLLTEILRKHHYEISVALDGHQALQILEKTEPDLILLDIMMPIMGGFEVCEKIKKNAQTKEIPIIFLTAKTDTESIRQGFKSGGIDYITKPFNKEELLVRINSHIELKQSKQKLVASHTQLVDVNQQLNAKNKQLNEISNKLSKYLSPQVYRSIFQGKQSQTFESKRKTLTVFFSDIKGFVELTESLESETLTRLLNNYLNEMTNIALEYGGTVDKFIGDAVMVFFGDPESKGKEEDAIACVKMALAMKKRVAELQNDWQQEGINKKLQIRMGINTGYCTVGNFGSVDRMDYTIIGQQVNMASRLESNAQPDQIILSKSTFALVKNQIHCQEQGSIQVKGVSYPVDIFEALDLKDEGNTANKNIEGFMLSCDGSECLLSFDINEISTNDKSQIKQALQTFMNKIEQI